MLSSRTTIHPYLPNYNLPTQDVSIKNVGKIKVEEILEIGDP